MVAKLSENKRKRRRIAWNSPAGMAAFPTPQARNRARLFGFRPGSGRANTAVANANITQAGVEISTLSVNARAARARNASRMIRRSDGDK